MAYPDNTYIIAIGIDKYQLKEINNFRAGCCKNDCADIVSLLTNNFHGFKLYKEILLDKKATRANIIDLIQAFIDDKEKNNRRNNLIVYFSGHGTAVPEGGDTELGCWVPHDCGVLEKKQVLGNGVLVDLFRSVDTQGFLLISDSCNSGHLFMHMVSDIPSAATVPPANPISRWAMVSSSREELSIARGRNSFFTSKLLQAIGDMVKTEFFVEEVITDIRKLFTKTTVQHPICGRLHFQYLQNTGDMVFKQKDEIALLKSGKPLLARDLHKLNYKTQERELRSFTSAGKKHLIVFSGDPKSALGHLSFRAYFNARMKESNTRRQPIIPMVPGPGESHVLSILNQCLPFTFNDHATLARHLTERLMASSLLFEIQISDPQLYLPVQKTQLLEEFRTFLRSVEIPPQGNVLAIFIIDSSGNDYQEASQNEAQLNFINTTKVSAITREDYEDFCTVFRQNFIGDARVLEHWDLLLDEKITTAVTPLFDNATSYPETVMEHICRAAGCEEIIITLLNPFQN